MENDMETGIIMGYIRVYCFWGCSLSMIVRRRSCPQAGNQVQGSLGSMGSTLNPMSPIEEVFMVFSIIPV